MLKFCFYFSHSSALNALKQEIKGIAPHRELLTGMQVKRLKFKPRKNTDIFCYLHKNYKSLQTSTSGSFLNMKHNKQ